MNAVRSMKEGKKVRLSFWRQGRYIFSDKDSYIRSDNGDFYNFFLDQLDDLRWSIYEDSKKESVTTIEDELKEIRKELALLKKETPVSVASQEKKEA